MLCVTDGIDGYLARRHGTTRSGAFLDPARRQGARARRPCSRWSPTTRSGGCPSSIIAVRELGIQAFRSFWGEGPRRARHRDSPSGRRSSSSSRSASRSCPLDRRRRHVARQRGCCGSPSSSPSSPASSTSSGRQPRSPPSAGSRELPARMRCDVVAVGTELLLGQIVDTNSSWIGEQLAAARHRHLRQTKVGDNLGRIVDGAPRGARARRRGDRVRRARADPRRHHPRGDRRGDGRRARAPTTSWSSVIRDLFAPPRPGACPRTTCARPTCPSGATRHRAAHRHRAGPHLPASGEQGRLRGARRAVRDEGDARAGGAARPRRRAGAAPVIVSRTLRTWGESESRPRRAARPAHRRARRGGQPDDRVPRQRHRGHQGAPHRQGRHRRRGRGGAARRRGGRGARHPRRPSCSAATTTRWSPWCRAAASQRG